MKKPLVSIIIPCYNYGEFLEQSVTSVTNQTYENIEVIVINDGSTDNTQKVAERLRQKGLAFTYIEQENQGIIATRNKGIALAQGDYIIQLDADDWLDPAYVEKTVILAQEGGYEIVYTQMHVFGRAEFDTKHPDFNLEYLKHDGYIHISALVKKGVFKSRRYDEYLNDKGNEDWDLFLDACMDGAIAGLVDEPLLYYRKHTVRQSRADAFEQTRKEVLVRHHVLSKQNAKHPGQMWYFSPYINLLKKQLDTENELVATQTELAKHKAKLQEIRATLPYRVYARWRRLVGNSFKD